MTERAKPVGPEARLELLHRNIQKFGTITNTLSKACELNEAIRAVSKGVAAQ